MQAGLSALGCDASAVREPVDSAALCADDTGKRWIRGREGLVEAEGGGGGDAVRQADGRSVAVVVLGPESTGE